jgi:hypothetical protein
MEEKQSFIKNTLDDGNDFLTSRHLGQLGGLDEGVRILPISI